MKDSESLFSVAVMTHEQFAQELTRFGQACSRGDAGQALASRSALLLHDKALQVANEPPVLVPGPQTFTTACTCDSPLKGYHRKDCGVYA